MTPATRRVGDLEVSALGLGCMAMSAFYGSTDRDAARRTLRAALGRGVTLFDTSDFYGDGDNEALLGEELAGAAGVTVATKVGLVAGGRGVDGSPDHVRRACDASLQRLRRDRIDLYYLHRVDPEVPVEESVGALGELVAAGKVRAIGVSEASAATIRRAHAVHPLAAVQSEWSLLARGVERTVLPTVRELGIAFVPYSPLGRGLLAGRVADQADLDDDDFRRKYPWFAEGNVRRNAALAVRLHDVAAGMGASAAQVALAWLLHQGPDVVPIPGARSVDRLAENLAAAALTLNPDQLAAVESAVPAAAVAGDRSPDLERLEL